MFLGTNNAIHKIQNTKSSFTRMSLASGKQGSVLYLHFWDFREFECTCDTTSGCWADIFRISLKLKIPSVRRSTAGIPKYIPRTQRRQTDPLSRKWCLKTKPLCTNKLLPYYIHSDISWVDFFSTLRADGVFSVGPTKYICTRNIIGYTSTIPPALIRIRISRSKKLHDCCWHWKQNGVITVVRSDAYGQAPSPETLTHTYA